MKKIFIILGICCACTIKANYNMPDSAINVVDTACYEENDSISTDTLAKAAKPKKSEIDEPVKYTAKDSLFIDMDNKKVYLYGEATVNFKDIELKAEYIEFDMSDKSVYATGPKDSLGVITDFLNFKEGNEDFKAHWLRYNFNTKKGFIHFVKTQQENGTLIGDSTKRMPDGNIFMHGGSFSTCDLDHPHFYIGLTKAKAVPGDKIVSGPAYLVIADIPLPIVIPFGFFPNTKNASSGLLFPTWGEDRSRGFYLMNGGYYFAFSDYMDLKLRGSIYANGSWGLDNNLNYKKRYKFSGNFSFTYNVNINEEKGYPNYAVFKDYSVSWTHSKSNKSSPNTDFSASVRMSSSANDRRNSYDLNRLVTNTKSSSINYAHRWPNTPFRFSSSLTHSQNSIDKSVNMVLPNMSFDMDPINPFQRKEFIGKPKWYENFEVRYNAEMQNRINTLDSLLFKKETYNNMDNGFKHNISPQIAFNLNKFSSFTPSLSYTGVLYTESVKYKFNPNKYNPDTSRHGNIDTIINKNRLYYAHAYTPGVSLNINPKFFGMYTFKNSSVKAFRHVMSPSAGISFTPDIRKLLPNYYDTVTMPGGGVRRYSKFENRIYGTPYPPGGKSASISMQLNNNFELKYKSKKDTSSTDKKIKILDYLNFNARYDLIADSFNLSDINMNTAANFWEGKFNLMFNAVFDPYAIDKDGNKLRYFALTHQHTLSRIKSATLSIQTNFSSSEIKKKSNENPNIDQTQQINPKGPYTSINKEVDYDIPWSVNLSYDWGFTRSRLTKYYNQSITFNGDLSITKKWKITISSGYDFTNKEVNPTNISISRDLHCWEMRFNWIPIGYFTSYNFTINVKAPILLDMKYTKNSDFRQRY